MSTVKTHSKILYVDRSSFANILAGYKTSLIEDNSRAKYQVFDEIKIIEINERTKDLTGNSIFCLITYMMSYETLPENYLVFSIKPLYNSINLSKDR